MTLLRSRAYRGRDPVHELAAATDEDLLLGWKSCLFE